MNSMDALRSRLKSWGGQLKGVTNDYASGQVIISLIKDGQTYQFAYKGKNATEATSVLAWSIRTLINCDDRGILPFKKTAREYLLLGGPAGEATTEAEEKHFEVLTLTSRASNDEVKKQFRKLATMYHPDRAINNEDRHLYEEKMGVLNGAYAEIKKARKLD